MDLHTTVASAGESQSTTSTVAVTHTPIGAAVHAPCAMPRSCTILVSVGDIDDHTVAERAFLDRVHAVHTV